MTKITIDAEDVRVSVWESDRAVDADMHKGLGYRDPYYGPFLWLIVEDGVVGCGAHMSSEEVGRLIDTLNAWLKHRHPAESRPKRFTPPTPPPITQEEYEAVFGTPENPK